MKQGVIFLPDRKQAAYNPDCQDLYKGFFKISRNPMYLGMLLISLGVVCYFASPISLLVLVGFVIYITRYQIIPEERALNSIFGDEFSAYKKQVRRWL